MIKTTHYFCLISVLLIFIGCSSSSDNIPTYKVERNDFDDFVIVEGTAEPMTSTALYAPDNVQGIAIYLIPDGTLVNEGDIVCEIEDKNIENELETNLINLETAIASFNKTKADLNLQMALLEADVKTIEATTEIANLDSLGLLYSTENNKKIRELEILKAQLSKQKLEERLLKLKVIQEFEVKRQENSIQRFKNIVNSLQERMSALVIKSPKAGIAIRSMHWVTGLRIIEGDVVFSSMPIITIPDMSQVKIVINATESEFKRINVDNKVKFTFDAMPENEGWGIIKKKSPIGVQMKRNSKVKYFVVETSVDSLLEPVTAGMSSLCKISVNHINDTITIPQIAVFSEDSMKVVYVKQDKYFEMRQIITGSSSLKTVVVPAGLSEKEEIALLKPRNTDVKTKTLLPDSIVNKYNGKRVYLQNKSFSQLIYQ
ncbi:MAG: hypothetical protein BGO29_06520 [Bacteroidales bacterium 36-12]|nr:MAG: hypothetical protein BGO29_06520 [Bacteroidales bacterium 36-12]